VFVSADVQTTRKMGVTALMNRFCERGYDVTLISETFGNHLMDYRCDHRLRRLSMDMGVKNCSTRAELLAHFASHMPPSVFILTDFDCPAYREYPAVIEAQSAGHRVICLCETPDGTNVDAFAEELPEEVPEQAFTRWEALVAEAAARPDAERSGIKLPTPGRGIRDFFEKKVYYRERQRAAKYVPMRMSPEQVRKAQLLASKMLLAFERICQKHELRYYVAAGSLLGAVRSGGPIPWDDDVDVIMPRAHYDKFIKIAQSELPEDMALPLDNYPYGFHRMQIKGTKITRLVRQKGPRGVFIDILPLDGAPPAQRQKTIHKLINRVLLNSMDARSKPLPLITMEMSRVYECVKRIVLKCFVPRKLLFWLWKRNATRYDIRTAKEWVCLAGLYGYDKECFPKEYWGEPVSLPYEGREIPVMRQWEKYLISHYGDYMMPTPVLCRRTHYLFAIDFGKYETMSVQEIEREVEEFAKNP